MQTKNKEVKGLLELVNTDMRFKRFKEFIQAADLEKKLSDESNLTLFVPTNEAFTNWPAEKTAELLKPQNREHLRSQLLLHMIPGIVDVDDLRKRQELNTEAGEKIKVIVSQDNKSIKLANANVVLPKEEAKNGLIYPLDALLQPIGKTAAAAS